MIDETTALKIANDFAESNRVVIGIKDMGDIWLISYNNETFAKNREWNRTAYGYLPAIIDKIDGEIHQIEDVVVIFPNRMKLYISNFLKKSMVVSVFDGV